MKILKTILRLVTHVIFIKGKLAPIMHRITGSDSISILMYHGVTRRPLEVSDWCFINVELFEKHIKYIKDNFHVMPLSDIFNENTPQRDKPVAAITFDDGFYNNYSIAYPILEKYQVPATIFLTTGLINTDKTLWYCYLNEAVRNSTADQFSWENEIFDISNNKNKSKTISSLKKRLKHKDNIEMENALFELYEILGYSPMSPLASDSPFRILNQAAIAKMYDSSLINFGAHTVSHPILTKVSKQISEREIFNSIESVSKLTGTPCLTFAYPNGSPDDFNTFHINLLQNNNINLAVTTIEGINNINADRYQLKRIGIGNNTSLEEFVLKVHGYIK